MRKRGGGVGVGAGLGVGFGILVHGRSVSLHYFVYFYYASHPFPSCPSLDHRLAWPGLSGWLAGCQSSANPAPAPFLALARPGPPSLSELRAAAFSHHYCTNLSRLGQPPIEERRRRRRRRVHTLFPNTRGRSDQIRAGGLVLCEVLSLCLWCRSVSRRPVAAGLARTSKALPRPGQSSRPGLSSSISPPGQISLHRPSNIEIE